MIIESALENKRKISVLYSSFNTGLLDKETVKADDEHRPILLAIKFSRYSQISCLAVLLILVD